MHLFICFPFFNIWQNIAPGTVTDPFDAIAANETARAAIAADIPYKIPTGDDTESLIGQALLTGRREAAVELCLADGRYADAIIIAMTGGSELLARTQCRYLQRQRGYLANIISALVTDDWSGVVAQCTTDSWREALAATLTHATDQMPELCERLGERLLTEDGADADGASGGLTSSKRSAAALESAILCYICAGNVERLVEAWPCVEQAIGDLQELVEIVMVLQRALELQGRRSDGASGKLADLLARYAGLLAAQGALSSALSYLGPSVDPQVVDLRERLYYSLGHKQAYAPSRQQQQQHIQQHPQQMRYSQSLPLAQQQRQSFSAQQAVPIVYPGATVPVAAWQPPVLAPTNQWNTAPLQGGPPPILPQQPTVWNPTPVAPTTTHPPMGLSAVGPSPAGPGQQPARPPSVGAHGTYTYVCTACKNRQHFIVLEFFTQAPHRAANTFVIRPCRTVRPPDTHLSTTRTLRKRHSTTTRHSISRHCRSNSSHMAAAATRTCQPRTTIILFRRQPTSLHRSPRPRLPRVWCQAPSIWPVSRLLSWHSRHWQVWSAQKRRRRAGTIRQR